MTRLRYLPSARRDLIEIHRYIARDSEAAADRLIDRIRSAVVRLRDFPESAPARPDIAPGLRGLSVGAYIAYYEVQPGLVTIVRVLHAARDPKRAGLDGPA